MRKFKIVTAAVASCAVVAGTLTVPTVSNAVLPIAAAEETVDTDGDGLSDALEARLRYKYGTNPEEKDLFLQLNWMPSERDQAGCKDEGDRVVNAARVGEFLDCSKLSDKSYAPTDETLREIIALFKKNGINLHIDAGQSFATTTGARRGPFYGGEDKEGGFKKYFFETDTSAGRLPVFNEYYDRLVQGERQNLYYLGYVGDWRSTTSTSTGISSGNVPVFYVANVFNGSHDQKYRNTLVHEFGHQLGFDHGGPDYVEEDGFNHGAVNYKIGHDSIMSYKWQLVPGKFDYQQKDVTSGIYADRDKGVAPDEGETFAPRPVGYKGYVTKSEWGNIDFLNRYFKYYPKEFDLSVPAPDPSPVVPQPEPEEHEEVHEHDDKPNVIELENLNKESYNGNGTLDVDVPTALRAFATTNAVRATVRNAGPEDHEFTLVYKYDGKVKRVNVPVPGAGDNEVSTKDVILPLEDLADYTGKSIEIEFALFNAEGDLQVAPSYTFEFLDYSEEERAKVAQEIAADTSISQEKKAELKQTLDPEFAPIEEPVVVPEEVPDTEAEDLFPPTEAPTPIPDNPADNEQGEGNKVLKIILWILAAVAVISPVAALAASWAQGGKSLIPNR